MGERIQARVHQHLLAPAEQVYDAWLDPQQVRHWLAAALKSFGLSGEIHRVEIDSRVGGKFLFSDLRDGREARHWGTWLELVRPNKLVFTWIVSESEAANPSIVTLAMQSSDNGCDVTLVQEMDESWRDYLPQTEAGWARMLQQIESCWLNDRELVHAEQVDPH